MAASPPAASGSYGTTPYTIQEAIEACRRKKSKKDDDSPVDLLAVVVESSTCLSHAATGATGPHCVWIRDATLPPSSQSFVSYHGSKALDIILRKNLVVGDIVRFNGVQIRADEDGAGDDTVFGSIIHKFYHPWSNEEAGPEWARLCHVDSTGTMVDFQPPESLPKSAHTNKKCIEELVEWYRTNDAITRRIRNIPSLSQPHCRHRSILELQTSVGVLSNLTVLVVDVQESQSPAAKDHKRKRSVTSVRRHQQQTFAMVSDGQHSIVFVDTGSLFSSVLKKAKSTEQALRLSCIQSQRGSGIFPTIRTSGDDNVVLIATKDSTATLLPRGTSGLENVTSYFSSSSASASQASIGGTQIHSLLSSQQEEPALGSHLPRVLDASIQTISVGDFTLSQSVAGSRTVDQMVRLLEAPDEDLDDVTVRLALVVGTKDPVLANASINFLRALCGGLESSDLVVEHFRLQACGVLQTMLQDEVELRWTLAEEPGSNDNNEPHFRVVRVSLPGL